MKEGDFMKLNLAQMQAVQAAFESFDMAMESKNKKDLPTYGLRPVFKYNGHLLMGDLYETDQSNQAFVKSLNKNRLNQYQISYPSSNYSIEEAFNQFLNLPLIELMHDPTLMFEYVSYEISNWQDLKALPTKFIKNVKCLDGSFNNSINFIELNGNDFEWISLASKN